MSIDRAKEFVTVATGPTSGIYYPIGGAFATALGNAGYKTSAQATGASVENINLILNGEAELAIAMQDSVVQAYEGFGAFEKAEPDLRASVFPSDALTASTRSFLSSRSSPSTVWI